MNRLLILFLAATNVFVVLYAPQPLLPLLAEDFQISIATASLVISATIFALALSSLLMAPLFDRWDRKKVILLSSGLLVLPSVMQSIADSFATVLFWRSICGLFIPGVTAILMAYAAEEFPVSQRGRVMGIYVSANVAGGLLGRVISGPIAEAFSWHAVFAVIAVGSAIVVLLVWRFLPASTNQSGRHAGSFLVYLRNPALLGAFFIGFSQFFAFIGFFTYLPFHAAQAPFFLSVTQISLLFVTYVCGMLSAPAAGFLSDRIGRRATMAIGHLIGASGILLSLGPSIPALVAGCCLLTLGNFASQSATTAYVTDIAATSRGAATSLYLVFFYLGGSLGAWVPGLLWKSFAWQGVVVLTVGTILLALLSNLYLAGRTVRQATAGEGSAVQKQ
ncbi:MFS transporter [Effusibacillus pohliae]|uniref:MFS transporter n=1 Tax=Effusibacillus pohliae TaxID=232270 RepID=UPI000364AA84|nr:MFS transporter [Effusibacillus pohliae]